MEMKRKHKRLTFVFFAIILLASATTLVLIAFEENIVFFYSPSEIRAKRLSSEHQLRIGGLVKEGSIERLGDGRISFVVTDLKHTMNVRFNGIPPDLFREGQGVVVEGHLKNGVFIAETILAKHDENYMPPEVADAIKKSGQWKENYK